MKKIITTVALTVALMFGAKAQQGEILGGVNLGYLLPMGKFGDAVDGGLGYGISGKYFLTDNLSAGINANYFSLALKSASSYSVSSTQFHLSGDYFFMTDEVRPYAGIDFGMTQYTFDFFGGEVKENYLSYGLGAGLMYFFNDNFAGNGMVRFNSINAEEASNYLSIGLGVTYKLH
ncbi:MAG: outer membrane beta-barrel protein [Bacteroidota bacterium]